MATIRDAGPRSQTTPAPQPVENFFRPNVRAMQPYVPGEQPPPGRAIKLNTNENPYPPSPAVAEAIAAAARGLQRYPDPLATEFRRAAAGVLGVGPDQVLCGNGSDDILTVVTRAFVGPGDAIRFPDPSYILYRTLGHLQDARIEERPFAEDWSLSPAFFEPSERLRLVYLPNPNSPTGTMVPKAQIVSLAEGLDCMLLVDEAYVDFAGESCVDLPASLPNVIVSRTLSKSYALAGLRFGYCVAHPRVVAMLRKVKDSYNTDAIANAAAAAAVLDQEWLAGNVRRCNATRGRMTAALRAMGFACIDSQANFVWAKHPTADSRRLYETLKAREIYVRYMNYPSWTDGLRISVGTDPDVDAMLAALGEAIADAPSAAGR